MSVSIMLKAMLQPIPFRGFESHRPINGKPLLSYIYRVAEMLFLYSGVLEWSKRGSISMTYHESE